ncbi:MAG TPA: P-loop NTPase [Anaerolineae bacterium]|nr:P-loop NTPase [Anaerolineae bacterium]
MRDLAQVEGAVEHLAPDVLLLDMSCGVLQQIDLLRRLAAPKSGLAVIVVAMLGEVEIVQQAMLQGAHGFLLKPFTEVELLKSVRQAYELLRQRRAEMSSIARLHPGALATAPARGDVIVVFGPKGGVGRTTIAVNLAVALHKETNKRVILVDADLSFGDVDTALNMVSATSLAEILSMLASMDDTALEQNLVPHHSGIQVLPAAPELGGIDGIQPEQLRHLLARLAGLGEGYVVVDTWSTVDDCTLAILDSCQHLVLVTTPQVMALRDTRRFLDAMRLLNYDLDRMLLVLNQCYHRVDVKTQDVERALGHPVAQIVEYAPGPVTTSLNRGVPLVTEYRSSLAAQNIVRLAGLLTQRSAQAGVGLEQRLEIPSNGSKGRGFRVRKRAG